MLSAVGRRAGYSKCGRPAEWARSEPYTRTTWCTNLLSRKATLTSGPSQAPAPSTTARPSPAAQRGGQAQALEPAAQGQPREHAPAAARRRSSAWPRARPPAAAYPATSRRVGRCALGLGLSCVQPREHPRREPGARAQQHRFLANARGPKPHRGPQAETPPLPPRPAYPASARPACAPAASSRQMRTDSGNTAHSASPCPARPG